MEEQHLSLEHVMAETTDGMYLTIYLAGQLYGIPVSNVEQIVSVQDIVAVPEFPHYAKGIMNLRGNIIPVIDMRLRLNMPEAEHTERTCIVVTSVLEQLVGFIVDGVDEVTDIGEGEILPVPSTGVTVSQKYVEGVCKHRDKIVLCLALEHLFSSSELGSLYQTEC